MNFGELSAEITKTTTTNSLFPIVFLFSPSIPHRNLGPALARAPGAPASHLPVPPPRCKPRRQLERGAPGCAEEPNRAASPVPRSRAGLVREPHQWPTLLRRQDPGARAARTRPPRNSGRALADGMMMPGPFFLTG
jgi:hypothetical protein